MKKYIVKFINITKGEFVKTKNGKIEFANRQNKKEKHFNVFIIEQDENTTIHKTANVNFTLAFKNAIINETIKEGSEVNINDKKLFN